MNEYGIKAEDLPIKAKNGEPNIWRIIADKHGIDVVLDFASRAGGARIDVPSMKRLMSKAYDRQLGITS